MQAGGWEEVPCTKESFQVRGRYFPYFPEKMVNPSHIPTVRKTASHCGWSVQDILKALLNTLNDTEVILPFPTLQLVKSLSFYNVYTSSLKKVPLLGGAYSYSPLWRTA